MVETHILLVLAWNRRALAARNAGSHHGESLYPDGGRRLAHGAPCDFVAAEVRVCQKLVTGVVLGRVELHVARPL